MTPVITAAEEQKPRLHTTQIRMEEVNARPVTTANNGVSTTMVISILVALLLFLADPERITLKLVRFQLMHVSHVQIMNSVKAMAAQLELLAQMDGTALVVKRSQCLLARSVQSASTVSVD